MANDYSSKFELFREFFAHNEELDIEKLREEEHGKRKRGEKGREREGEKEGDELVLKRYLSPYHSFLYVI